MGFQLDFVGWLEAVQTSTSWGAEIPFAQGKDIMGAPLMQAPGFRHADRMMIERGKKQVEEWLDQATAHLGVHWLVNYIEPVGEKETPQAKSLALMKQAAAPEWGKYQAYAKAKAERELQQFQAQGKGLEIPPNPNNTIVYVKPTSRVHALSPWQQIHNIGHAVWGNAKKNLAKFIRMLRETIYEAQQSMYDTSGKMPTWAEMVVILARLLDLKSFQRIFSLQPGQLDMPKNRVNTALNSIMEAMFELVAAYLRNKGKIPLRPRHAVGDEGPSAVRVPERTGRMQPVPEIERKFGVRPWVWEALDTSNVWEELAQGLTQIVEESIKDCVWGKIGGPIYSTYGYITTQP